MDPSKSSNLGVLKQYIKKVPNFHIKTVCTKKSGVWGSPLLKTKKRVFEIHTQWPKKKQFLDLQRRRDHGRCEAIIQEFQKDSCITVSYTVWKKRTDKWGSWKQNGTPEKWLI